MGIINRSSKRRSNPPCARKHRRPLNATQDKWPPDGQLGMYILRPLSFPIKHFANSIRRAGLADFDPLRKATFLDVYRLL